MSGGQWARLVRRTVDGRKAGVLVVPVLVGSCARSPSIFASHGASSDAIARLGLTLTIVSSLVVVIVSGLVLVALFRRRPPDPPASDRFARFEATERRSRRWIVGGTAVTTLILLGAFIYSLRVLIDSGRGAAGAPLTVRVVGHRFWWSLQYLDPGGRPDFVTANELHLPVGTRVRLQLEAGDVIHSFWVPELAGKTDLIPGQRNEMWIEANQVGRYVGQCAEFCGPAHALMRLVAVVQTPDAYQAWARRQREAVPPDPEVVDLLRRRGCMACHRVGGAPSAGLAGPDLTHLAERSSLASGIVPNTAANLGRWLRRPDSVKPGVLMPRTGLTRSEVDTLVAFLEQRR